MKIIIPFDPDTFFNLEENSLLSLLELKNEEVLDYALTFWMTLVYGSIEQIYDITIEEISDLIDLRHSRSQHGYNLQEILHEHGDMLTEILKQTAHKLHHILKDIPFEVTQMTKNTGEYHFLKIESINVLGKYAVIISDIADA